MTAGFHLPTRRDANRDGGPLIGVAAALVAWSGMAGWALLGVSAAGFGAAATPAAVALAVGGSAGFSENRLAAEISVVPLGVSLVGAVLLAACITSWRRLSGAVAGFLAGLAVLPFLPGELAVDPWRTWFGGVCWLVVVLGVRVATWWYRRVRTVVLVLLAAAGAATVAGLLAAVAGGARMAGTMLLGAPNLLAVGLTRGLGVSWQVMGDRLPLPTIDAGGLAPLAVPVWPLALLAAAVVLPLAVVARWHAGWVCGVVFAGLALLGGASVELRAGPLFAIELGVRGNVLVAAGTAAAAGLVASLLVAGARYWQGRRT